MKEIFNKNILQYFENIDFIEDLKKKIEYENNKDDVEENETLYLEFEKFLKNNYYLTHFMSFLIKSFNIENISFYNEINQLYQLVDKEEIKKELDEIIKKYLQKDCELELNLPETFINNVLTDYKKMEEINEIDIHIFDPILKEVKLMLFASFNDFVITKEYSNLKETEKIESFFVN